jgi:RNA polymerase sigma factor (sigma-70 family)
MRRLPGPLLRHLQRPPDCRTDGDLIAGFLGGTAETDFAELVRRHGPMVWGVCRRVLPDPADAEDAFQATFLVLVRRARRLAGRGTVGPWLHQVAVWTARNTRRRNARQMAKRVCLPEQLPAPAADPDLHLDLDAALLSLPEKFRSPIVLCHLLGFSRADAAERLGCKEGTLSAWLSRGLAKLRAKLGGLDPAKALTVAAVGVPMALQASVTRAAVATQATVAVALTSTVSELVKGVVHMFWIKKATAASVALFAVFALGVGVGISTRTVPVADGQDRGPGTGRFGSTDPLADATAKAMADLEEQLNVIEARYNEANVLAIQATDKPTVEKWQKEADRLAGEVKILKAKLDALESLKAGATDQPGANKPKPGTGPLTPSDPFTKLTGQSAVIQDIDKQLTDLKAQLNSLARDRDELAKMMDVAREKAVAIDRQTKDIQRLAQMLLDKRAELARQDGPTAGRAGGAFLELTVHGKQAMFEFSLRETDANGKEVGRVIVREPAMLVKTLTRTHADPTAPKDLRISAQEGASYDLVKQAIDACKMAGFTQVKFTGTVPPEDVPGPRRQ